MSLILSMLTALVSAWSMQDSQPPPVADTPTAEDALLRQVPQTPEDLAARMTAARARLAALEEQRIPADPAADAEGRSLREAIEAVVKAWEGYIAGLERLSALMESVAELGEEAHLKELDDQVRQFEEETRALRREPAPSAVPEEQLRDTEAQVQALDARIATLAEAQSQRSQLRSTGFQQQREQLEKSLGELRTEREAVQKQLASAPATAQPEQEGGRKQLHLKREQLHVKTATIELALRSLDLEQRQAELLATQDDRLLAALRDKLDALKRRKERMSEARSQTRVEILEAKLAAATAEHERAALEYEVFAERVLLTYFREGSVVATPRERFRLEAAEQLRERLAVSQAYWSRVLETLDYRTGDEASVLHQRLRKERKDLRQVLGTRRTQLQAALARAQALQTVRDKALDRLRALRDGFDTAVQRRAAADRTRLESQIAAVSASVHEEMREGVKRLETAVERLGIAVSSIEEHIHFLDQTGRRLQWRRIISRDPGWLGGDWSAARAELRTLWDDGTPNAAPAQGSSGKALAAASLNLLEEERNTGDAVAALVQSLRADLKAVSGAGWSWFVVGLTAAVGLGFLLHRVGRAKGVQVADLVEQDFHRSQREQSARNLGLSARIDLLLWNQLGDLAIPLLVLGMIALGTVRTLSPHKGRTVVLALIGVLALALTLMRLVHHLFEAESPPHRPIACGDAVARHYRRWLTALVVLSLIVVPVTLGLWIAEVAPATQGLALEAYKAGFLLLLLLFVLPKGRVLGGDRKSASHWTVTLAIIVYPIVVLGVAALLVAQVIGYGAMVTHVGAGVLLTLGIVVVVGSVTEYLADVLDHYAGSGGATGEQDAPVSRSAASPGAAHRDEHERTQLAPGSDALAASAHARYALALVKWAVRFAGLGIVLALIMQVWNVQFSADWLSWRVAGLGGVTILAALLLDRILFSALQTLEVLGRLPGSTVTIIRRWARGMLAVAVVLVLVAIAGFQMQSVWQVLTAAIAMVAIGFVAVWSILSNVLATLVILVWRPFNVGEQVELLPEGIKGQVVDINFIYTVLKSKDGARISVPNNLFAQKFIRRSSIKGMPKRSLAEQLASDTPLDD